MFGGSDVFLAIDLRVLSQYKLLITCLAYKRQAVIEINGMHNLEVMSTLITGNLVSLSMAMVLPWREIPVQILAAGCSLEA